MLKRLIYICLILALVSCETTKKTEPKPNIVLIVLDDLAYSDLGVFGSEIKTPIIDALAKDGQIHANFYTSPMCASSRAMLISGNDNHIEGMGRMMNQKPSNTKYKGKPYYEEDISERIVAFPKLLQKAGYYTCMAGKWHLGWEDSSDPYLHGFDDTFALRNGFANHYNNRNYGISDVEGRDTVSIFTRNGKQMEYPEGEYSTNVYLDYLTSFVNEENNENKPFFAYVPLTAPHWPLQVDEAYSNVYKGYYDKGYQALMQTRLDRLKENGILPKDAELPNYPDMDNWNSLSPLEQKRQAKKMEIYAGMVAHLDESIGNLISVLKENNKYENTIFIMFSDNGSGAEDFKNHPIMSKHINDTIINSLDNLGTPSSFATIGKQWAQACSVPFKKYKGKMYEGGIKSPLIITGKGIKNKEKVQQSLFSIQDIAPTILEIAGIEYPKEWEGKVIPPQRGKSVLTYFKGNTEEAHKEDYVFAMEHRDAAMVRKGHWKLVNQKDAADNSKFELYDISKDISEQNNLSQVHIKKYNELLNYWETFKEEVHVLFLRDEKLKN